MLERAAILLSALADEVAEVTQRHTEAFAEQCATIKPEYVTSFGEEVAR